MLWLFNFHQDQIFMDFVGFLSMIIYEVLYTCCLRHNICSTWFLDIRISTCFMVIHYPYALVLAISDCSQTCFCPIFKYRMTMCMHTYPYKVMYF